MFGTIAVNLYPTLECNLSCNYCMVDKTKSAEMLMSINTTQTAIRKTNGYQHVHLGFVGGEPLLVGEKHFKDLYQAGVDVCHSQMQRVSSGMITNGTLLTPEFIDWSREKNHYIFMSYDGKGKRHPHTKRMLPYIAEIQKQESVYSMSNAVIMVINDNNIDHLKEAIDDFLAAGITKVCNNIDINLPGERMPYYLDKLKDLWDYINQNELPIHLYTFMDLITYRKAIRTRVPGLRFNEEFGKYNLGAEVHIYPDEQVRPCMPTLPGVFPQLRSFGHMSDYLLSSEYQAYIKQWIYSLNSITGDSELDEFIQYTRGGMFIFDKHHGGVSLSGHNVPYLRLIVELSKYVTNNEIKHKVYRKLL